MELWKPTWLTNRGFMASIVFDANEMSTFDQAEQIANRICEAFGIDPDAPWVRPEAA